MGSGVSSTVNRVAGSGALGPIGMAMRQQKLSAEKKGRQDEQKLSAAREAEGIAREKAIAEESVRAQKEKQRKQTIFAGGTLEQNIFRKTLGAGTGSTTLG